MRYRELLLNRFSGFPAAVPLQNRPTGSNGPTYGALWGTAGRLFITTNPAR